MEQTFSNNEITTLLKSKYDIGEIKEITRVTAGASSECYYIATHDSEFIFKDIEVNFMNNPEQEPLISKVLSEAGIPVATFYQTRDGEYIWSESGRVFHLQSFIKGQILPVNTAPEWFMNESSNILGRIHKALESIPLLKEGIGEGFFNFFNPETVRGFYLKTLEVAQQNKETRIINDVEYRISLLDMIKEIKLNMKQFTCKNTHGDYFISQIICGKNSINGIIDLTAACVHPVSWEIIRSYSFADPECINGNLQFENLKKYIGCYLKYSDLNDYDLKMMPYVFFYQLVVSNYFNQYYVSKNSNRKILLDYAHWSTSLCRWFEKNVQRLSDQLVRAF